MGKFLSHINSQNSQNETPLDQDQKLPESEILLKSV